MSKLLFDSSDKALARNKLNKDRILKFLFFQIIVVLIFELVNISIERFIGNIFPVVEDFYYNTNFFPLTYIIPPEILFILYSFSFGHVKLYSDGVSVPKRGIIKFILGKERFIPYKQIKYCEEKDDGMILFLENEDRKQKKYFIADYYYKEDKEKFTKILKNNIKLRKTK